MFVPLGSITNAGLEDTSDTVIDTTSDNGVGGKIGVCGKECVSERHLAMNSYIFERVWCTWSGVLDVVAFLMVYNTQHIFGEISSQLTITVKHSFKMKSTAVLHVASLVLSKFRV